MGLSGMEGVDVNGDSSSARVDDSPTSSTSFGMIAESPALPIFRDDALVDKDILMSFVIEKPLHSRSSPLRVTPICLAVLRRTSSWTLT